MSFTKNIMSNDGSFLIIEFPLWEALEEVASGVFEYSGLNDEHARDIYFYNFHKKNDDLLLILIDIFSQAHQVIIVSVS